MEIFHLLPLNASRIPRPFWKTLLCFFASLPTFRKFSSLPRPALLENTPPRKSLILISRVATVVATCQGCSFQQQLLLSVCLLSVADCPLKSFFIGPRYTWGEKNMAKWGIPEKSIKNVAQGCSSQVRRTLRSKVMANNFFRKENALYFTL